MPPLELTGERTLPDVPEENYWYQRHLAVYEWIAARCEGKTVADLACGEGYGSNVLAERATDVIGVDANPDAFEHARRRYQRPNLRFERDLVENFDSPRDVIVFLQTIEHVERPADLLRGFAATRVRLLRLDAQPPHPRPAGRREVRQPLAPARVHRSPSTASCSSRASARVEILGLFHARKLRAHELAIRAGWDRVHPALRITKPFYDRFIPANQRRRLRPAPHESGEGARLHRDLPCVSKSNTSTEEEGFFTRDGSAGCGVFAPHTGTKTPQGLQLPRQAGRRPDPRGVGTFLPWVVRDWGTAPSRKARCGGTNLVTGPAGQAHGPSADADTVGDLAFVLHSHMPYVEGFGTYPFGEEWLFDAVIRSYLPVLGIARDLTMTITPVLADQLEDRGVQGRLIEFCREYRVGSAEADLEQVPEECRLRRRGRARALPRSPRGAGGLRRRRPVAVCGGLGGRPGGADGLRGHPRGSAASGDRRRRPAAGRHRHRLPPAAL